MLAGLVYAGVSAQDIYLQTDFENGVPSDFTVLDRDENPNRSGLKKVSFPSGSWSSSLLGSSFNRAAVSSSYSTYNYPVEDWLITPRIHVSSSAACVRWDAKSVHYDFRDGYRVMVSEGGMALTDFVELFSIEEEAYFWKTRVLSLADYAGKDIYIAFVHNSTQRFLLAIDNLTVGELTVPAYGAENRTPVSVKGGEDVNVCGGICNLSSPHAFCPVCVADGVLYEGESSPVFCEVGDTLDFSFYVPAPVEGKMAYKVGVPCGADTVWVVSDTVYCSAFARNLLVEEYTATWCTSCPEGTLKMHEYEYLLRDCIIPVVAHSSYYDVMGDTDYSAGMDYWLGGFPSFLYDRYSKSLSVADDGKIYEALSRPVLAEVEVTEARIADGGVKIGALARFAESFDNVDDRYRMAYIVTENVVASDSSAYKQSSNLSLPQDGEFYFLTSPIPASMMRYHNVARGISTAFTGVPGLLPSSLVAGEEYPVEYQFRIPSSVLDPYNISVTVVVMETRLRTVLAACRVTDINYSEGVSASLRDEGCPYRVTSGNGCVYVCTGGVQAEVCVYAVDGRCLGLAQGTGEVRVPIGTYGGSAIVTICSDNGISHCKILINN